MEAVEAEPVDKNDVAERYNLSPKQMLQIFRATNIDLSLCPQIVSQISRGLREVSGLDWIYQKDAAKLGLSKLPDVGCDRSAKIRRELYKKYRSDIEIEQMRKVQADRDIESIWSRGRHSNNYPTDMPFIKSAETRWFCVGDVERLLALEATLEELSVTDNLRRIISLNNPESRELFTRNRMIRTCVRIWVIDLGQKFTITTNVGGKKDEYSGRLIDFIRIICVPAVGRHHTSPSAIGSYLKNNRESIEEEFEFWREVTIGLYGLTLPRMNVTTNCLGPKAHSTNVITVIGRSILTDSFKNPAGRTIGINSFSCLAPCVKQLLTNSPTRNLSPSSPLLEMSKTCLAPQRSKLSDTSGFMRLRLTAGLMGHRI